MSEMIRLAILWILALFVSDTEYEELLSEEESDERFYLSL